MLYPVICLFYFILVMNMFENRSCFVFIKDLAEIPAAVDLVRLQKVSLCPLLNYTFLFKFFCFTSCSIKLWYDSHESISEIMIQGFLIRLSNLLSNINLSAFAVGELRTHEKIFCNFHCMLYPLNICFIDIQLTAFGLLI